MTSNPTLFIFFDLLVVLLIIKIVGLLKKKYKLSSSTKYWAVFLYILIVFRGLSIPYFSLVMVGIAWSILNISPWLFIILILTLIFFLFQEFSLIVYPFLAILAALGTNYLIDYKISINGKYISYPKIFSYIFILISIVILILSSRLF